MMQLNQISPIKEVISFPASIIIGEKEELSTETLEFLFEFINDEDNIKNVYVHESKKGIATFLKIALHEDDFYTYGDVSEITGKIENNFIAIGFDLYSDLFQYAKNTKEAVSVFFVQSLGVFSALRKTIKNVSFVEQLFEEYVSQFIKPKLYPALELDESIGPDGKFINRGAEIELFKRKNIGHLSFISGFPGIGKRRFVKEIRENYGLNPNCFEIHFSSRENTFYDDVFLPLSKKAGVKIKGEISEINFGDSLREIFQSLNKLEHYSLIFWNIDLMFDFKTNTFLNKHVDTFFEFLSNENIWTKKGRVLLVSERVVKPIHVNEALAVRYPLRGMTPYNIKLILSQHFIIRNHTTLSAAIMEVDDDLLENVLCGHPFLAKRFVNVAIRYGINPVLNDPVFRKEIDKEKINYINEQLLNKAPLEDDELTILRHLSMFQNDAKIDYLKQDVIIEGLPKKIATLKDKFLLEASHYKNGDISYYVPKLIKQYVISRMSKADYEKNNRQIGGYYWSLAEKFGITPDKVVEYFNLALFHFQEAKDAEKIKQITLRFQDNFLNKAEEHYDSKNFRLAFYFYDLLYETKVLTDKRQINYFLKSAVRVRSQKIGAIYSYGMDKYPHDEFIKTTYANFLLKIGKVDASAKVCKEVLEHNPDNYGMNNFYCKVLFSQGEVDEAVARLEKWIKKFESKKRLNKNDQKQLKAFGKTLNEIKGKKSPHKKEKIKNTSKKIKLFISYSHKDENYKDDLINSIAVLVRTNKIDIWQDRLILAGKDFEKEIFAKLNESKVICLLISTDFVKSDYCFSKELEIALKRHKKGEAVLIPIIIRPTSNWQELPFGNLTALPTDGLPITEWGNVDKGWENVANEIGDVIKVLREDL